MKTERLYYSDCYLRRFEARVANVAEAPAGFRVYLDRTAFYPESGGQPSDRGELGGVPVLDVQDEDGAIAHLVASRPAADTLQGSIDWARRFDHMQQHTGQHILSAAFERTGGYKTVSFHLGEAASTIDLDSDRAARPQAEAAEDLANAVVFEDRPVHVQFKSDEEVSQMDLRKPTERKGEVRLIEIADFDLSACGGTHVSRTGAVGAILIRKLDRVKGLTRVEFVCGTRAVHQARSDYSVLSEAARQLSTAFENVPTLVAGKLQELRDAAKSTRKLSEQLAEFAARDLHQSAPERNGRRIVRKVFAPDEIPGAKAMAHALAKLPGTVALMGTKARPAELYFAQSPGASGDMSALVKSVIERFGGRGGGTRDFAQAGGLDENKVEESLVLAESLLA